MDKRRFSGLLNQHYDSIKPAWPYREELLDILGKEFVQWRSDSKEKLSVLEIGCGSGEATKKILESNKRVILTAVEPDYRLARKLEDNLRKYRNRIRIVNEEAEEYLKNTGSESYDAFASSWVLHNFTYEERYGLLDRAYRVLKPRGLFITMDKIVPSLLREEALLFYKHQQRIDRLLIKQDLKDELLKHEKEDRSPDYKMKENEFKLQLHLAGFPYGYPTRIVQRRERDAVLISHKIK